MKGYCVDVRGFSCPKRLVAVEAIDKLNGTKTKGSGRPIMAIDFLSSIDKKGLYGVHRVYGFLNSDMTDEMLSHLISFNDLMLEAGFNYEDRGVEDFGWIDLSKCTITENKPASNKTRPQITREQYDAVMAQSDKRTFTKALDDLLAVEKEQLLHESAIRINELEVTNDFLNKVVDSWRESWERSHNSKVELKAKLEKQRQISFSLSFILISSLAALLVGIFLGSPSA